MTDDYMATVKEISAVDGVEVDIIVRGDEDRADKVLMDLKDRLGWIGAAYEIEVPPDWMDDRPDEYTPLMSVNWARVFGVEDSDDPDE
jgi:hypothetical protein